ncbi:MAG: 30S ribosomal protein S6, partial [Deltaproteobacteria bacterium]|nr:30S ribosomal protein S6 [Deltaproteobacteria bacterium]
MHTRALKRHREYEIVYILAPSTTPGGAEKVGESIREVLEEMKGKLLKVTLWGIRSMAYKIKGKKQGIYYYMRFIATQGAVDEMERRLKLSEAVLRYLTVRLSKHEVDPTDYTVVEDEAAFKGIDDLHASLQERNAPELEAAPAGDREKPPAEDSVKEAQAPAKDKPATEAVKVEAKASKDKPATEAVKVEAKASEDKPAAKAVKVEAKASEDKPAAKAVKVYAKAS